MEQLVMPMFSAEVIEVEFLVLLTTFTIISKSRSKVPLVKPIYPFTSNLISLHFVEPPEDSFSFDVKALLY